MPFSDTWHTLLDELDELPEGSTLITPLSNDRFRVTDVQERVGIEFPDRDIDETQSRQRDQFETLYRRITDEPDGFELDRLPPDADLYPAVLSLHPRFEVDKERKETRLQGLKDQLAATEGEEAEEFRGGIEKLEDRIEELTEFRSGASFHTRAGGEP